MTFTETILKGVFIIDPERVEDERGFFARIFCRREFSDRVLSASWVQCSVSFNRWKGTVRGMHFQKIPHEEVKLVRCTRGAIYDVVIDLRPDSATFTQYVTKALTAENGRLFYVPAGCAHGFQTLEEHSEVEYQISEFYRPELARGVRWDDPAFKILWPLPVSVISERDRGYPDFTPECVLKNR